MSKLVRDLIPEVIPENKRDMYRFSTLDKEEYRKHLNQKLLEEANEYIEEENIEELAEEKLYITETRDFDRVYWQRYFNVVE